MAGGFKIDKRAIEKMTRDLQREFDRNPVSIPVRTEENSEIRSVVTETISELEFLAGIALDSLYRHDEDSGSQTIRLSTALESREGVEIDNSMLQSIIGVLEERGFIKTFGSFGEIADQPMMLMDSGRLEAVRRLEYRQDVVLRQMTCRQSLLRAVYEANVKEEEFQPESFANSPLGWFFGEPFTGQDAERARRYLLSKELLLDDSNAWGVSSSGVECIEEFGGVGQYVNRKRSSGVNVTIQGDNHGQLAVANRDVQQTQNTANDSQVLMVFAEALREFASLLSPDEAEEYEDLARLLDKEAAKESPDQGWVRALMEKAKGMLGRADKFKSLAQLASIGFQVYKAGHLGDHSSAI
jgi:hypothetical protein